MTRTLLLALAVLGVATFVAVGSYSALAGSDPVSDVAGAVIGQDAPDGEEDDAVADDADDDEGDADDEADEAEDEADVEVEEETGEGAENVAQVIADAFGVSQEEVLALHDEGIGFGALFKLYQLSQATGVSVDDLLASMDADGEGYAFGKRFKELTEEQRAVLDDGPKNLGQLVSASHHADEDGESEGADAASQALEKAQEKFASQSSNGHGPPDGVPAHGHN
jgi:hypothetical protein